MLKTLLSNYRQQHRARLATITKKDTLSTSGGLVSTATPAPPRSWSIAPPSPAPWPGPPPNPPPPPGFETLPAPPSFRSMRMEARSAGTRREVHVLRSALCLHCRPPKGALLKPKAAATGSAAATISIARTPAETFILFAIVLLCQPPFFRRKLLRALLPLDFKAR